ncbi:hypothetical protein N2152v2_008737 [Parachlorella kessleri]
MGLTGNYAKTHVYQNDDLTQVLTTGPFVGFARTKVCMTMGPSLNDVDVLCKLLEAGATCARIDLTWELLANHRKSLQLLQEAMHKTRRLCAVMLDCKGRDILVKRAHEQTETGWPTYVEKLKINAGQKVTITTDPAAKCTSECFPISYAKFPAMVSPGDGIFLGRYLVTGADDSSLYLQVLEVLEERGEVICEAHNSAVLEGLLTVFHQERSEDGLSNLQAGLGLAPLRSSHGLNCNDMSALSEWDRHAITTLCSEFEVDFVTLSYCRSPEDVAEAKDFLSSLGRDGIKVVAKCETRQSLLNFRSISAAADAIIISRGNLGLDVAPEKVALIQKGIISACVRMGKPSLITRVVDSMVKSPRPTRAEATDVANAVLDGVDGIMLGAETYRGKYPLETVQTVVAICREAELVFDHRHHFDHLQQQEVSSHRYHSFQPYSDEEDGGLDPEAPRSRRRNASRYALSSEAPGLPRGGSSGSLGTEVTGITAAFRYGPPEVRVARAPGAPLPMQHKLESIASSAVRAADKVSAKLIVCITHTGRTASLIAKYRPPMPIMTLVVPFLKNEGLKWTLEGRSTARQALLTSGLLPVLAAPTPSAGETLLEEAIALASVNGLVQPEDHVVAVSLSSSREAMVKIVSVSEDGGGIKRIRPTSLLNMLKAAGMKLPEEPESLPQPVENGNSHDAASAAAAGAAAMRRRLSRGSVILGSRADPLVPFQPPGDPIKLANGAAREL